MDVISNISKILESEPDGEQIDQYLSDVRDSLVSSNKQFIGYQLSFLFVLILYHLTVNEGWKGVAIGSIEISDISLFEKAFLILPSGIFLALSSIGYLRRLQREVYDYLAISRQRILGETGVHELRLPSNYILGLDILRSEGGIIGKLLSNFAASALSFIFILGPAIYMTIEASINLMNYGYSDLLATTTFVVVILSLICGMNIMRIAAQIKA